MDGLPKECEAIMNEIMREQWKDECAKLFVEILKEFNAEADPQLYTAKEVAGMLKIDPKRVYELPIPCIMPYGEDSKSKRWKLADILEYQRKSRVPDVRRMTFHR
jgi:hypothetical protein